MYAINNFLYKKDILSNSFISMRLAKTCSCNIRQNHLHLTWCWAGSLWEWCPSLPVVARQPGTPPPAACGLKHGCHSYSIIGCHGYCSSGNLVTTWSKGSRDPDKQFVITNILGIHLHMEHTINNYCRNVKQISFWYNFKYKVLLYMSNNCHLKMGPFSNDIYSSNN